MSEPTIEQINSQQNNMSNNLNEPYYGVYSLIQENYKKTSESLYHTERKIRKVRYNIYQKADGTNVKITEVNRDPNYADLHKTRFRDSVYVGRVVKWIKAVYW